MSTLFFDTETTGLPSNRQPLDDPSQPWVCQIGAIVEDATGRIRAEMNLIIRPEGWEIPEAATAIHGISQDDAEKYGMSARAAISLFFRLAETCTRVVAHNASFDRQMMEIMSARTGNAPKFPIWEGLFCTMKAATDIVRLPPTEKMLAKGMKGHKAPNLQEAHEYFIGHKFTGAHDAMADVRACRDVYRAIMRSKKS